MCRSRQGWFVFQHRPYFGGRVSNVLLKPRIHTVLRILRVTDPIRSRKSRSRSQGHIASSSAELSSRLCTGPGGATIEIGQNMWPSSGLKIDSAPTDVVWARGSECSDFRPLATRSNVTHT